VHDGVEGKDSPRFEKKLLSDEPHDRIDAIDHEEAEQK
jgi:hypothetical protein